MTNRIAPPEGISRHWDAITYLNNLSIQWKLRAAGEPHTPVPTLIEEWEVHRPSITKCRHNDDSYWVLHPTFKADVWKAHPKSVAIIDEIIAKLKAEDGWPFPTNPQVTEHDIARLREAIRELEACKEDAKVRY